jgi:hypothetical protein
VPPTPGSVIIGWREVPPQVSSPVNRHSTTETSIHSHITRIVYSRVEVVIFRAGMGAVVDAAIGIQRHQQLTARLCWFRGAAAAT